MTEAQQILIVEDDSDIREMVSEYLLEAGFGVTCVGNAAAMHGFVADHEVELVILDLKLPDDNGLNLVHALREKTGAAIIILTGSGEVIDRVVGLEMGADDYVTKPFELRELLARVRSVLRRMGDEKPVGKIDRVAFSGWTLDLGARVLMSPGNEEVPLTTSDFNLLSAFVGSPNQVLTRDRLLDVVYGRKAGPFDRSIDVQVGRLRRKIEPDSKSPQMIKTVRGAGYIFVAPVERHAVRQDG